MPSRQPRKPEHRVELVQLLDARAHALGGDAQLARPARPGPRRRAAGTRAAADRAADRDRAARPSPSKMPAKSARWNGSSLASAFAALLDRLGQDHLAHRVDLALAEEHVLGAAQADAFGAERDRLRACSGWSALVRTSSLRVLSAHSISWANCWYVVRLLRLRASCRSAPATTSLGFGGDWPREDLAGEAVDRDDVAFPEHVVARDAHRARLVVDLERLAADDADLAHLPADERRVADVMPPRAVRMPSAACMPRMSSGDVSRRTRITRLPGCAPCSSASSAWKTIRPVAAPGPGVDALGEQLPFAWPASWRRVEDRLQQLVEVVGLDAQQAPASSVISPRRPCRRRCGPPAKPVRLPLRRLQHLELALLDGELDVLHVAVVLLERARGPSAAACRPSGMSLCSSAICLGVRMPATTSSPWALIRYSP